MGMESFYIDIIFRQEDDVNTIIDNPSSQCDIQQYSYVKKRFLHKSEIKVDNVYVAERRILLHKNANLKCISLEACFSNYKNNIDFMYSLFRKIKQIYNCSIKIGTDTFNDLTFSEFETLITEFYKKKYDVFVSKYGYINMSVLPRSDFYINYH